jgi:ferredoxin
MDAGVEDSSGGMRMRVSVDHDKCEGHAKCEQAAPEVFQVRDDDKSYVLIEEPDESLWAKVRQAEKICPRQAVIIEE